jgi:hypothetical protein
LAIFFVFFLVAIVIPPCIFWLWLRPFFPGTFSKGGCR